MPRLYEDTVRNLCTMTLSISSDMGPFWDGYRDPLASVGITLNELPSYAWVLPAVTPPASLPYATRCSHEQPPSDIIFLMPRLTCGRDAQQQDVVLKLIDKGTMEDQIYRTLSGFVELYDTHAFPCILPPIAIIESPYEFSFVAMPMWGSQYKLVELQTVRQILTFMRCALTGLREYLRSASVSYALYDFDCAVQLPPDTSLKDCRRPPLESTIGKPDYHPGDTWQGELDYNPFAFDVACLGNLFVYHFAEVITAVPLLAPLFAKMTTSRIDERFSAAEALEFLREVEQDLMPDLLDSGVALKVDYDPVDHPDLYWSRLSPELQRQWNSHRPPPLSWANRLLRRLCTTTPGYKTVMFIRRCLRAIFTM
ncbi:hypothetical protein BN946_scf184855.g15 [Trametes cinnabarina]|uniref:Protein kinase domain-containing protein n=1 Tax=Pycnoporus cinnabarinus TaxID=5643 RepID=A0A060SLM3_PYCCI|nr:hypothetical protein BN946_scf184855.g15 [Trametes cinnabarina]